MSNLGTLSFDVDLDLSKLKSKIDQQNEAVKQALEGLQVKVATKSVGELAQQIQSELNNHQFAIKLDEAKLSGLKSDIVSIAEKSKEIADNFARMGQGGGGTQQAVNIDLSKFNGISEIIEKIEGEMKRLYNVFADTTDGSGKQVAGLITNLSLLKEALEQLGTAAKNFTPTQQLNEAATAAQNVATAAQNAAKATKTASDEEAEATKKANIERERQLKLIAEIQTMLSKIGGISSENTGLNPQRINEVKQAYEGMLNSLSTIPPSKSLQEISAELATLKANTKGFFQEVSQSQKAVESIRLVRYALKQVNEQMASGNTSPKLEGFREQLQAINREMHNLMKVGNLDGIQTLFAGHKGMSDGVVSIIRQMVSEMKKLGVATQETAGITSHLSAEEQKLAQSIQQSTNSMRGQSQILSDLKTMAMQYLSVWGAQSFIHNIIQTGGLLEQQRMSIGAILGDLSQANHLFGQIQQLALKSPFGVVQLDTMSKQLTAYNFKYSELYDWTKRLADISAATGTEVSRLSLALGHVRSEGALSGYTLRQFAMGNVPLLQTLAQQLGKTTSEIRKMTREKAITYDDVEKALRTLTDEGGIFFNAQEVMSNALNAKFKNMHDAFDIMFGKMAESDAVGGTLKKVAELMTVLAKNWEQTGAVILSVAGYLGIHKLAMLANNKALVSANIASGEFTAKQMEMQAASGSLTKQMILQAVATGKVEVSTVQAAAAVHGLTTAQLEHVRATGKVSAAYNLGTIAASKYSVAQLRVMAQYRQIPLVGAFFARMQAGWYGVTAAAGTAARAIGTFLKAFWPMLAISAVVEVVTTLIQKSNQAKERIQDLIQTASEGFRNLEKDALQFKVGASVDMDDKQLKEAVKDMDEILKSYLPTNAHEKLNEAFKIDPETGKSVHSLKEQYEILAEQIGVTKEAYKELANIADIFEQSNNDTDGWLDESFRENTEDYINALKARDRAERDFVGNNRNEIVDVINKTRDAFKDYNIAYESYTNLYKKTEGQFGFGESDLKSQVNLILKDTEKMNFVTEELHKNGGDVYHDWVMLKNAVSDTGVAFGEMSNDMKTFNEKNVKRLEATFGATVDKWTDAQKLAVQKALEVFMTGIDGYSSMAEAERLKIEKELLRDYNIEINLDAREANKGITELQAYLNELVGKDWVVKLKLQSATTMMDATEQLEKEVKAAQSTIDKFGNLKGPDGKPLKRDKNGDYVIPVVVKTGADQNTSVDTAVAPWAKSMKKSGEQAKQAGQDAQEGATGIWIAAQEVNKANQVIKKAKEYEAETGIKIDNKAADKAARQAETAANKAAAAAKKDAQAKAKAIELEQKFQEQMDKLRRDMEDAQAQASIAAIQNDAERERAERKFQHEKTLRDIRLQEEEIYKKIYEERKKIYEAAHKNDKGSTIEYELDPLGALGWQGVKNSQKTEKEAKQIALAISKMYADISAEESKFARDNRNEAKNLTQYLYDYLKEYGSIQDKKYAITKEYDRKIEDAETEMQKALLRKQKENALKELDFKEWQQSIDWEGIFNELKHQTSAALEEIKNQLRTKLTSGDITAENAKILAEKIKEIDTLLSQRKDPFASWLPGLRERLRLTNEVKEAEEKIAGLQKTSDQKREDLIKLITSTANISEGALRQGFSSNIAVDDFESIVKSLGIESEAVTVALTDFKKALENASQAQKDYKKRQEALANFTKGGSVSQYFSDITAGLDFEGYFKLVNSNVQSLNELVDNVGLSSTEFGHGVSEFTEGVRGFSSAVQSLASGDVIGAVNGVIDGFQGFGHLFERIGGFSFNGSNAAEINKQLSRLSSRNEILTDSIDRLNETMSGQGGSQAIETYAKMAELQKEMEENLQKQLKLQMEYHDAHRSFNYYWGGFTEQQLSDFNRRNNTNWNGDLASLTPELAAALMADADMWQAILQTGKGGYGERVAEKIKALAEQAGVAEEQVNALNAALTAGTTKDSVFDDFLNSLYDLADGAEDVMKDIDENWQKMVNHMVVNNLIGENFRKQLEDWYTKLANLNKARQGYDENGNPITPISDEEYIRLLEELKKEYNGLISEAQSDIDTFIELGVIKPIEEAEDKIKDYGETISDAFKELLSGSVEDVEAWGKEVQKTIAKTVMESLLFDDAFNEWAKNWGEAYSKLWEQYMSGSISNAEYEARLNVMQQEWNDKMDEMTEKGKAFAETFNDSLELDTTFTDMKDSFVSAIMDMDGDVNDFANDMKKTIVQKLVEAFMVSEKIKPLLDDLQETFNYAMGLEGASDTERAAIIAAGFTDAEGIVHKGVNDVTNELTPLQETVRNLLTAIGYEFKGTETLFSGLGDTIKSSLMDMEDGIDSFMDSITKTVTEDLIKSYMATEEFQNGLKKVKDDLEAAVKAVAEAKTDEELAAANEQLEQAKKNAKDFYEAAEEGTKAYTDALKKIDADTTFKGMADSFKSALMDMSKTAEDWANEVGNMIAELIIKQMVVPTMIQPLIDNLQDVFKSAMDAATTTDENDNKSYDWDAVLNNDGLMAALNDMSEKYPEIQAVVKHIMDAFGLDTSNYKYDGFSNLADSILESLTGTESDIEKWATEMGKNMGEQMAKAYIDSQYGKQIEELNEQWQQALQDNNIERMKEIEEALRSLYAAIGDDQALEDLIERLKTVENPFKDMADDFASSLMDMEQSAEDFANNIAKKLTQEMINKVITEQYQSQIDALGEEWRDALEKGDTAAIERIRQQLIALHEEIGDAVKPLLDAISDLDNQIDYTLQDMKSTFVSALMDMTASAQDFADNISKIMAQAFIEKFVLGDAFDKRMEEWQKMYEQYLSTDISEEERRGGLKALRDEIASAGKEYTDLSNQILDLFGLTASSDQEATMNMSDKITYDQADQLLGINLAQELTLEQILATLRGDSLAYTPMFDSLTGGSSVNDEQSKLMLATMQNMAAMMQDRQDGILTQVAMANSHLQLIRDYSKSIRDEVMLHLGSMDSKLSHLKNL